MYIPFSSTSLLKKEKDRRFRTPTEHSPTKPHGQISDYEITRPEKGNKKKLRSINLLRCMCSRSSAYLVLAVARITS